MPPNDRPPRRFRKRRVAICLLLAAAFGLWLGNSSALVTTRDGQRPFLLAHRGLAQTFEVSGIQADTCTAQRIHHPAHPYLENTLDSMRAAFTAGADMVEFDVKLTRDGHLAVFHDSTLECRTNGHGTVDQHDLAELRRLDVGHGYTSDGGVTYPFRGKGIGLLPTAPEVLAAFPGRELLMHIKNDNPADGTAVAMLLGQLPAERQRQITVYGEDRPVDVVARRLPGLRVTSKAIMKRCLTRYAALSWSGHVPDACRHTQLHLPERYGRWLWGWPHRFVDRMREADTRVVLVAGSGDFSAGFDRPQDIATIPPGYAGAVWTNRIDAIAPLLSR